MTPASQHVSGPGAEVEPLQRLAVPLSAAAPDCAAPWVQSAERILALTLTLLFVLLIAAFYWNAGGLWRDEANSVSLASLPTVGQIMRHLDGDSFPLLWFLLLRAWTRFASADLAVRALGLLTALGIPAVLFWSARANRIGFPFWSFLLLGLNPVVIRCIGATRAYGLGVLLVLLTSVLLWRACRCLTWRTGLAAFLVSLLCVHCLYYDIIFVGALCSGGACVSWRHRNMRSALFFAGIFGADCCSLLPYLPTIRHQHAWSALIARPVGPGDLWHMLTLALGSGGGFMVWAWAGVTALGIGMGLFQQKNRALSPHMAHQADRALYALVGMGVGALGYGLFLLALKYPTNTWYYVVPMALTALCLESIMSGISHPIGRMARGGACFILLALTFSTARSGAEVRQTGIDLAAAFIEGQARPHDLVLVNPWYDSATFMRYYHGSAPWQTVPPMAFRGYGGMDQMKRQMMTRQPLAPILSQITRTLRGGGRVWLVGEVSGILPGTRVPPLPPAPQSAFGWDSSVYARRWGQQVQSFLLMHAAQSQQEAVVVPQTINPLEDPQIEICRGWRGTSLPGRVRTP